MYMYKAVLFPLGGEGAGSPYNGLMWEGSTLKGTFFRFQVCISLSLGLGLGLRKSIIQLF